MSSNDIILVGIDVGMTYTGVAHARVPGSLNHAERERIFESVRRIERWPGKYDAIADKNPTVVSTPEKPKHEGIKWGFECDRQLSAHEMMYYVRHDHFKLELDIELLLEAFHQDVEKMTEHHSQVREWYRLYLAELYHLITRSLIFTYRGNRPGNFLDFQVVQFMFSVPTTWGTKPIGCFEEAIRHSQFGSVPKHFYQVGPGFTEADAAAVYTMHTLGYTDTMHTAGCTDGAMIQDGDVMIVADLGGGTTDVTVLKIISRARNDFRTKQLAPVEGRPIGSTKIDVGLNAYLQHGLPPEDLLNCDKSLAMHEKCLSEYDPKSPFPLKCVKNYHPDYDGMWVRDSTLKQEIVNLKEKFGTDLTKGMNDYLINVMVPNKEGISSEDLNYEEWGIKRGQKILPRQIIRQLFDEQLNGTEQSPGGIFQLIDNQIAYAAKVNESHTKIHIALTGGFSQSPYIREQLKARYMGQSNVHGFHTPPLPQLAVCFGLVYNQLYRLTSNSGQPAFIQTCRASYGFLYDERHDARKHGPGRADTRYDRLDRKHWVKNRIHWMISQGDELNSGLSPRPASPFITHLVKPELTKTVEINLTIVKYEDELNHVKLKDTNIPETRPDFLMGQRVEVVGTIKYKFPLELADIPAIKKKTRARMGRNLLKQYWEILYQIEMVVTDADLKFELIFNGEKRCSETDGRVQVEFDTRGYERSHSGS